MPPPPTPAPPTPEQSAPPAAYYGPGPYPPPAAATNGFAVASLVLGILWLYWLGSVLAVIFGHVALGSINRSGQGGKGMAIAGLALGYTGLGILALVVLIGMAAAVGGA